ncbi:hypothetical protein L2E82_40169 [Cichorium intybus]|uniref:Uncharacterized protein n=1 Tax=Cichorium intybus TaxID=13427 RepID=A0ACB9AK21_CICIN|nr:hypothetical protein L2E82_40169 [Cichorium intybus]
MRLRLSLVACFGVDECRSPATVASSVSNEKSGKSLNHGFVHEKKVVGGGKKCRKDGRPPVQWRPSLCTIYEEAVVKTKRIQVYVPKFTPTQYKQEFVLRGSWDMVSPVTTSFIF